MPVYPFFRVALPLLLGLLCGPLARADDLWQVYQLALTQDPQLGEARARYQAEHTLLAQGRARLLPSVNLVGRSARNAQAPEAAFSYADGFNSHSYGVSIEQSLLNLQAWYGFRAAQDGDRRALATLQQAEQELLLRVARAYFDVLRSTDNLAAFNAEEQAAAAMLEQTSARLEVGLAAITDQNEAQAGFDLARVNRLREERVLGQRRLALESITGAVHGALATLAESFPINDATPADPDAWVALAASNNPALQMARADLDARSNEARATAAAQLPTLSLTAGYNDIAESANPFSFFPNTASNNANITLSVNVPLYAGGLNQARKRQAYHLRDASEQALVRVQRQSERDTRDSYLGMLIAVQAVAARQQALTSARTALAGTETGAAIGTRNVVDVLLAQRTLFQALRELATARYDYVIDTLTLKQAAGVLSPEDLLELNGWLE